MSRVGAIDCGTNTIKLLVADLDPADGSERVFAREMRVVRLGQDVDRTGRLADEALERVFTAVEEYAEILDSHGVGPDAVRFCATSAARDADNSDAFVKGIRERLGVEPEVIAGDVEAQLAYDGATRSLPDLPGPLLVVDIGGGSTEFILGDPSTGSLRDASSLGSSGQAGHRTHGRVRAARSLDIGSVRLTERLMPSDPPTVAEIDGAAGVIDRSLDELADHGVRLDEAGTVIGVAGTVTTVAALLLGLDKWDRDAVHQATFPVADVHALADELLGLTVAQRLGRHIVPGRADVIGAGALILDRALRRTNVDRLLVSDSDILDGIAWSLVAR
jgi:exopolyphosphatase / guanosine-5'-triphosphate,3'-diphosphate pyrophosphatase